ncbi:MAG: hypothetical protein AAF682_32410 [Planctomycetota bacterium]
MGFRSALIFLAATGGSAFVSFHWLGGRGAPERGSAAHAHGGGATAGLAEAAAELAAPEEGACRAEPRAAAVETEAQPAEAYPWSRAAAAIEGDLGLGDDARRDLAAGAVAWPEELTTDWVRETFQFGTPLADSDLAMLESIAAPFNADLWAEANRYATYIDVGLRDAWAAGDFGRGALGADGALRLGAPDASTIYSSSMVSHGWGVRIALDEETHPHLVELRRSMAARRADRTRALAAHLDELAH